MSRIAHSRDGVEIAVHDLGGAEIADTLLIAHATGFHGRVYAPMVDAGLSNRFHCIAPDLRGHGDSPATPAQVSDWSRFGDDVLAVLDASEARSGHTYGFGHSMGGAALVLAELARPGTFDALWLFEPILPPPLPLPVEVESPMVTAALRRRETFDSFDDAIANFSSKPPLDVFSPEAMRAYVDHGFAAQPDGSVRLKCPAAVEAATFGGAPTHHAFDRLGELTCPVVIAVGALPASELDVHPSRFAQVAAERIPGARLARFDHLGHFAPQEAPGEIAAAVVADLSPVG